MSAGHDIHLGIVVVYLHDGATLDDYVPNAASHSSITNGADLFIAKPGISFPHTVPKVRGKYSVVAPISGTFLSPIPTDILPFIEASTTTKSPSNGSAGPAGKVAAGIVCFCPHDHGFLNGSLCFICGTNTNSISTADRAAINSFLEWKSGALNARGPESPTFASAPKRIVWPHMTRRSTTKSAATTASNAVGTDKRHAAALSATADSTSATHFEDLLKQMTSVSRVDSGENTSAKRQMIRSARTAGAENGKMHTINALHGVEVHLDSSMVKKLDEAVKNRLQSQRKLILVLDLDHTLLHATCDARAATVASHVDYAADMHTFTDSINTFYIKLRPGVKTFLTRMADKFELHIDTFGSRAYAQRIASILDPSRSLFGDRIVSRCDAKLSHKQADAWLHRALQDDSMMLIVDDRSDMWPMHAHALVLIEPYMFFRGTNEVNNNPGVSVGAVTAPPNPGEKRDRSQFEATGDDDSASSHHHLQLVQEEPHSYLTDVERVLTEVHRRYFDSVDAGKECNTGDILQAVQADILKDTAIVFSGVFPLHADAERRPLYQRTLAFGACVADSLQPEVLRGIDGRIPVKKEDAVSCVTHVVARIGRTDKVLKAAASKQCRVVALPWLEESLKRYQRQEERDYILEDYNAEAVVNVDAAVTALQKIKAASLPTESRENKDSKLIVAEATSALEQASSTVESTSAAGGGAADDDDVDYDALFASISAELNDPLTT